MRFTSIIIDSENDVKWISSYLCCTAKDRTKLLPVSCSAKFRFRRHWSPEFWLCL